MPVFGLRKQAMEVFTKMADLAPHGPVREKQSQYRKRNKEAPR